MSLLHNYRFPQSTMSIMGSDEVLFNKIIMHCCNLKMNNNTLIEHTDYSLIHLSIHNILLIILPAIILHRKEGHGLFLE